MEWRIVSVVTEVLCSGEHFGGNRGTFKPPETHKCASVVSSPPGRLNVSLSRAQSLLIIVGDLDFLNNPRIKDNKFPEIIEYIQENQGCKITCAGDE